MKKHAGKLIGATLAAATVFAPNAMAEDATTINGAEFRRDHIALDMVLTHNFDGKDMAQINFQPVSEFPEMCSDLDNDGKANVLVQDNMAFYVKENASVHGAYINHSTGQIEQYNNPVNPITDALNEDTKQSIFEMITDNDGLSVTTMNDSGQLTAILVNNGGQILAGTGFSKGKGSDYNIVICPSKAPELPANDAEQTATPPMSAEDVLKELEQRDAASSETTTQPNLFLESYGLSPDYIEWGGPEKLLDIAPEKADAVNFYAKESDFGNTDIKLSDRRIGSLKACFEQAMETQGETFVCAKGYSAVVVIKTETNGDVKVGLPNFGKK